MADAERIELVQCWVWKWGGRRISRKTISDVLDIVDSFERLSDPAGSATFDLTLVARGAGIDQKRMYSVLDGQWTRAFGEALVRRASGGLKVLVLYLVRFSAGACEVLQLIDRGAPHHVVSCAVGLPSSTRERTLRHLLRPLQDVRLDCVVRVFETERLFGLEQSPMIAPKDRFDYVTYLDSGDYCPPPLSDPRDPASRQPLPRWEIVKRVWVEGGSKPVDVYDPKSGARGVVFDSARGAGAHFFYLPISTVPSNEMTDYGLSFKVAELRERAPRPLVGVGPVGDGAPFGRLQLTGAHSSPEGLDIARSVVSQAMADYARS